MVFPVVGGDGKPTGYEISNSMRFGGQNGNAVLQKTFSSEGNRKKFTIATWVKANGSFSYISGTQTTGSNYFQYGFTDDGSIRVFQGDGSLNVETTRRLRDPSAWYHLVLQVDTTQGTDSNRIKFYVNGTQETSMASTTYPSQNLDLFHNTNSHAMGVGNRGDADGAFLKGYLADYYFVDNATVAQSTFAETDDNGVWIPKDSADVIDAVTFGTNGFFLNFQQTGTSANSSGMGADTSGNDNHFASTNTDTSNITVDTPTNNFATLNPLQTRTYPTLDEGNLVQTGHSSSDSAGIGATIMPISGKWYVEAKVPNISSATDGYPHFGITDTSLLNSRGTQGTKIAAGFKINDAASVTNTNILGTTTLTNTNWPSWSNNDIINFALDLDNRKLYIGKNGTYINSGDPAAGSNHQITWANSTEISLILAGYSVSSGSGGGGDDTSWNYGNPAFSISSGNSDANGYGNFEYSVPSGYYAICTKNLAQFG
jgi:hypothetical protein